MPRFRFQWTNLPPELLQAMATGLSLAGDPAETLKRRYGLRPNADYIRETWTILLENWLKRDGQSCHELAEALRAKGLGQVEIRDHLEYLKSCNNSASLRNEALRIFLTLGERSGAEAPRSTSSNETAHSKEIAKEATSNSHPPEIQRDAMLSFAKSVVAKMYEIQEDILLIDGDGDLFIPAGSAAVFIRVSEEPDEFRIFSPLLSNVTESAATYKLINDINAGLRIGYLYFTNGTIVLEHTLIGRTINPLELSIVIDILTDTADFYDHQLQEKLGGDLFFRERDEDEIEV